ncbi:Hypothetical predicted protein [Mytilus galloprovincialis]|uniref:Right handed beta helix domain-containing protein n=1 Tax=Mytilus galloprovincialis TaxID=29158 RepID=A0A8B6FGT0_MYTGA|nr:Hypothetical predicted protein [Mytilus galloprovincialis]
MFSSDYPVTSFKNKWKGLELKPGGTLNIAHSVIRQGDICVQGTSEDMNINFGTFYSCNTALRVREGINLTVTKEEFIPETTFKIRNSEFIYNQYGIQFQGTTEKPSLFIKKCNISLSSGYGIHIGNWFNRALNDVLSRLYIDMSSIERNSNHGIYSGSTGRASIFVNNTIIKGHTGSIGIYSYRRYASSYTENITIMNSELSNNRLQSVYMYCYRCYYSVLTIINTTFESNFDRSSVEVYHSGEVSISIIGNSFHNCRGWNPVIGLSKVGHQSDLEVFGNTFRNSYAVISVNGPDSIMPINIQENVFMNNTRVSSNSKTSLITISNARLNFTRNSVQSCLMYSLVDIKDGVEHIFFQNKFIDNLLTPCYIKVESIFNRTHAISASYNFWGETDTDTIKSMICDFFVDSRVALVTVEQFYIDITMLSTLNISNAFEFIKQSDEKVYIVEGIFDSSVPLLFPEDSTFIVNRSILIAENGDVQISKASFNFSQDRGMRSYGKLEITNSELQGRDLKWTGFHIYEKGSKGRASIFVNNTVIKGHTGSIGIYSYRRYAKSYTENITIMNSELSNNRLQSVYMYCYTCFYSVLTLINTTFGSNFDRSSVEVYHSGEVSISIIGNSFHNCRGSYPVIGLSKVGHQSDLEVFGNTFRNSYAVISVNGPDSIMPINIQGNVFMNSTQVSSNDKTSLITISNAILNFTRNSVQSCFMYSLVDIKDGVEHIFSQNKFIDNLLTPCYIKVESIFNRTHAISASYNFWGHTDTDTIKSKICDFFVDSRAALVTIEEFYIDITMLSTLNISNAFEFIQQSDQNVYIVEGIFDSSVPLLFPEDSTFIINRSILIAENGDVQISKAFFNFSQDRGIRSYGKLEITNSELQGRDFKWTGFHIYKKGLNLQNVTLRDVKMCIEVLESCDVNIDSITVWNTDNFLGADELIGELDIYFRNSNITVNNEMLKVKFRKSYSIVIRDDSSIFSSNIGKIFEISELQTQDRITNISFDLFGSNLNSYGTHSYYQIIMNSCSGYLNSLIRNSSFYCTNANSKNVYIRTQANNINVTQNIFRMAEKSFDLRLTCRKSSKLSMDLERKINIFHNSFNGLSSGYDVYIYERYSHGQIHFFHVYDNVFTHSSLAINRYGMYLNLLGSYAHNLFEIKGNCFTSVKNYAVYIVGNVGVTFISENTFHQGIDSVKIDVHNSDLNLTKSDNVFVENVGSTAVLNLLQPNVNVLPILLLRNIFQNNLNTILLFRSPNMFIFHNIFENPNGTFNIKINSAAQYQNEIVNASLNFWGTTNVKEIGQKIYDKNYDDALMDVLFRPYLGSRNFSDIQNEEPPFISITGEIGGRVNGELTLTVDRSPYTVTANIEVREFDTLTLDPGVTLLFNKDFGINVVGTLMVNGSNEMPVMMLETVYGEAWRGIDINTVEGIYPTSLCYLHVNGTLEGIVLKRNYAEMKNISSTFSKGHGFTINLQQTSGNESCSIFEEFTAANNKKNGLQINSADKITVTKILISKCNVYHNDESGFSVHANIETVIEDCLIKENKQRGVYVEQSKGGDIFIKSSTLHRNTLYALEVLATNKIVVDSCFVTENSPINYYSYGACKITHGKLPILGFNVTFLNNTFSYNQKHGIYLSQRSHTSGSLTFYMRFNRFSFERRVLYLYRNNYYKYAAKIDISHNIFNNNKETSETLINLVLGNEDSLDVVENTFTNNTAKDIFKISLTSYSVNSELKNEIRIFENIFKDNTLTDSCLNLKSYHVVSVNRNTFMNRRTTSMCELQAPVFDEAYSINATHNYWGSSSLVDVLKVVCGFDRSMEKSYVYYMPFSTSEENNDFVPYAQDDFDVHNVLGGEITGTFTIEYTEEAKRISRSIFIRTNASLNIANGIEMQFDKKRGIYIQGNLSIEAGESESLFTNGSLSSIWYGIVLSSKDTGHLKLHDAHISNTEIGIQSKDKFLDLKNITINNSHGACLSMLSGAEGKFDFDGSLFHNCVNHGIFLSRHINASFTGLDISSAYEGIQLITYQTGHLTLDNIGIKNTAQFAVHVEFKHRYHAGNITIHKMKVTDSQTGFYLIVDNYYSPNNIQIRDNTFNNISRNAMQIDIPHYQRSYYSSQNGAQRFVDIGYNTFTETCGVTLNTWNSVNTSFHDKDFTGSSCPKNDKCFFSISADGSRDIPYHVFDIFTNKFMGIDGYCVIELKSNRYFSYSKGTVQFNSFLLNKVSRGVVVLDTSYFNISQNIFDNHDSTFDLYTTGSGDAKINATKNWFGNMTLSLVYDRIYDGRQDPSLMYVIVAPLLLEWKLDCSLVNNCSNQGQCVSPNRCRCFSGWTGKNCTKYDCSDVNHCYGNGRCVGPNKCDCHSGWEGETCIIALCIDVKNCSEHGICLRPGVCKCASTFTGKDCSQCVPLHWGPFCSQCPDCQHGTCNLTTGMCECIGVNWSDDLCDKCTETYYGPDCLPLITALQVVPNQGSDKGGTVVHVWGHNFPDLTGHMYICKFGSERVNGTWKAWNHVTCTAPQHEEGSIFLEVSPNGTDFTNNKIIFTYYATCPQGACGRHLDPPRGQCLFGGCSCNLPWTGDGCTIELLAPKIMPPEESQYIVEGTKYHYDLNLTQGNLPVRWELNQYPVGMTIDDRTGQVEWGFTISTLTHHIITATVTNIIGKDVVSWQLLVSISYSAFVTKIKPEGILPMPTTVTIMGKVIFKNLVQPKVVPVDVRVISSYSKRINVLPALTDPLSPSSFSVTYYPYSDDVGIISAVASHPVVEPSGNGAFNWTVLGVRCSPHYVKWNAVIENSTVVFKNITSLVNVGDQPIFNISSRVDGISGTYFQSPKMSSTVKKIFLDSLEAFETFTFDFIVTDARPLNGRIYIIFSTLEGTETRLQVNMQFSVRKPLLVFAPTSIRENIVRGTQKILDVQVHNDGEVAAKDVIVSLPNDNRLSLVSFKTVDSLNSNENNDGITISPNEVAMMSLVVTTGLNDGLGEMSGTIVLNTDLTAASLSYRFYITSLSKLNLTISVKDEYTYFASGAPLVSGAEVRLINPRRQYSEKRYTTNETGFVVFEDIHEDQYTLYAQAEGHSSYSAVILASPDSDTQEVFLERIAVKYTWTVTPTTVQDKYVIALESTFETQVPMPVVTVDPAKVNTIPYELGEEDTMEFTITNHGLIRADDVRFALPLNHLYLNFNMTVDEIGSVPANTTIKVSILVTLKNTRKKRSSASASVCGMAVLYDYICGSKRTRNLDITLTREYPGRPPLPCSGGRGWGSVVSIGEVSYSVETSDTASGSSITYNPVTPLSCDCAAALIKSCALPLGLNNFAGCRLALSSLATSFSDENTGGSAVIGSLNALLGLIDTFFGCVARFLGPAGSTASTLYTAARCLVDVYNNCENGGRRRRDVSGEVVNNLLDAAKPVDNFMSMMKQILNDENMYDVDSSWYGAFRTVIADESQLGVQLSSDEFSNILSTIIDETQKSTLKKFLQRWNNTATAWKDGTLNTLDGTEDIINLKNLNSGIQQYINDFKSAKTKGFDTIFDVFDHATKTYKTAEQEAKSGSSGGSSKSVCAKVRVRIVQELVLTRDAFNARLEIENGETSALENIMVEIRITQTYGNGEYSKDKFSIGKPSLIGISDVDGEGTLGKDLSGSAEWLMIPYSTAAPQEDTLYDVGGQLSYRVGGSNFSVPLLPDTITVKPNPSLVVHYFHEKYVRGDDPLTTDVVEPIIPFSLAVSVMNAGFGIARALRISSAQPEIIENEKGLLITFKIVGAQLGNNQIAPSLSVDFGDINSDETKTARWLLTSTLKGTFYNYTATFENINPLGDPQLSLLDELEYHELIHLVRIDTDHFIDDLDDFLVNDVVDSNAMPDKLYNSQNGSEVYDVYTGHISELYTSSYVRSQNKVYTVVHLKVTANASTWTYTRIENNITSSNSVDSQYLLQCESSSNRKLMIEKNVWQTTHILDKFFLHIFDFFPSNETAEESVEVTYDITFGPRNMYAPIFNMTSYSQTVPFDVLIGSVILTLSGYDIDNDQTSFEIDDENIKSVFTIDETLGNIRTKVPLNTTAVYQFKVMLVDHGIPPMSSMTNITISVTDYTVSSVPSRDNAITISTSLTSDRTSTTTNSAGSSSTEETVGGDTSTRSIEMYTSESQATPTITTESSIPDEQRNHTYTTSTVTAKPTTVKLKERTSGSSRTVPLPTFLFMFLIIFLFVQGKQ